MKNILLISFFVLNFLLSNGQNNPSIPDSTIHVSFEYEDDLSVNKYAVKIIITGLNQNTFSKVKANFRENSQSTILLEKEFVGTFTQDFVSDELYRNSGNMELKIGYNELLPIHYFKIDLFDENATIIKQYEGSVD